jgi:hypothetical protein
LINDGQGYLCRAADEVGIVLDILVQQQRGRSHPGVFRKLMQTESVRVLVTANLRS